MMCAFMPESDCEERIMAGYKNTSTQRCWLCSKPIVFLATRNIVVAYEHTIKGKTFTPFSSISQQLLPLVLCWHFISLFIYSRLCVGSYRFQFFSSLFVIPFNVPDTAVNIAHRITIRQCHTVLARKHTPDVYSRVHRTLINWRYVCIQWNCVRCTYNICFCFGHPASHSPCHLMF